MESWYRTDYSDNISLPLSNLDMPIVSTLKYPLVTNHYAKSSHTYRW